MSRIEKEDVSVGSGIVATYQRLPQKLERVFAEFIDNSTQSFQDHDTVLQNIPGSQKCIVDIEWDNEHIVVLDNAYGMSHDEFRHALKLNNPKKEYSLNARGRYGMGLKIAAAYLGDFYTIETTTFGSTEKYYAEIDLQDWAVNNPTTVDNHISDTLENKHYTKIEIKKLIQKISTEIRDKLIKDLSVIYKKDISNGKLEIHVNKIKVNTSDPELRINAETGSEYLKIFEGAIKIEKKMYEYSGWVGILRIAQVSDAGFSLSQSNRVIIQNYRPAELFKKSNSFEFQRVVGEITLDGWPITFNKDSFQWNGEMEKLFIASLKNNEDITNIFRTAFILRKEVAPLTEEEKEKISKKNEKSFEPLKKIEKTAIPDKKIVNNNLTNGAIVDQTGFSHSPISITWESVKYNFYIDYVSSEDGADAKWLTISRIDNEINSYLLTINFHTSFFGDFKKTSDRELIQKFALAHALAQISSIRVGLKESHIFTEKLNEIMHNAR